MLKVVELDGSKELLSLVGSIGLKLRRSKERGFGSCRIQMETKRDETKLRYSRHDETRRVEFGRDDSSVSSL